MSHWGSTEQHWENLHSYRSRKQYAGRRYFCIKYNLHMCFVNALVRLGTLLLHLHVCESSTLPVGQSLYCVRVCARVCACVWECFSVSCELYFMCAVSSPHDVCVNWNIVPLEIKMCGANLERSSSTHLYGSVLRSRAILLTSRSWNRNVHSQHIWG